MARDEGRRDSEDDAGTAPPVALVTGGGGGLGLAVVRALAAAGHRVVALDRDLSSLDATAFRAEECDVTDRGMVASAVAAIAADLGPPVVLVNAAGIAESAALLPPNDGLWERTLAVNVTGAWIATTACLPHMQEAGSGFVCNVASIAALEGFKYTAAYVASKHAMLGLTRALAADLEGGPVRVCAICPGFIDTAMTERTVENMVQKTGMSTEQARGALASMNRSGRLIDADEVVETVLALLARDDAHGEVVRLD
jgi:NAD(P)-dependent dehydrogenase (short-subunit alcohol dehydrogenase family)